MASDSLFNGAIKHGDLGKAALIANSILKSVSQDTTMDILEKAKVITQSFRQTVAIFNHALRNISSHSPTRKRFF